MARQGVTLGHGRASSLSCLLTASLCVSGVQDQMRWVVAQKNRVRNGELYRFIADSRGAFVQVRKGSRWCLCQQRRMCDSPAVIRMGRCQRRSFVADIRSCMWWAVQAAYEHDRSMLLARLRTKTKQSYHLAHSTRLCVAVAACLVRGVWLDRD